MYSQGSEARPRFRQRGSMSDPLIEDWWEGNAPLEVCEARFAWRDQDASRLLGLFAERQPNERRDPAP
jgi:hypothetical protein